MLVLGFALVSGSLVFVIAFARLASPGFPSFLPSWHAHATLAI